MLNSITKTISAIALVLFFAFPAISYTPPACSDTDADQTNNCGPADSGDAGTR